MNHHPHRSADKVRFSPADADRARRDVERQHAFERRRTEQWLRFKRERDAERAAGGGIAQTERAAA